MAEDLHKGLIERFRALPMARSAVLAGRTTADARTQRGRGHHHHGGRVPGRASASWTAWSTSSWALLLVLAFAYAMSWGFAAIGLAAPNSETAQVMAFPILFPLTFASTAFVPIQSMPGWMQAFASHQPVSVVVDGARSLMVGGYYHSPTSVWHALVWIVGPAGRPHTARRVEVPQDQPVTYPSPVRRRSSSTRPSMGTRTCSVLSRSRTVTASSSSESKSTVTHHGVPTSSWRR